MITLALAAIPTIFTVLKFLGQESANKEWVAVFGAVATLLILVAAVVFAWALRPGFTEIATEGFAQWRSGRLRRMNRLSTVGLVVFVLGVLISIVLFALLLSA